MDIPIDTERPPFIRTRTLIAMVIAVVVALACFIVVVLLPAPRVPMFKDPLRSFITGIGLLTMAYPFTVLGAAIHRRTAGSPYFEAGFIAGVLSLIGYLCVAVGLACVGFGIYDLVVRFLDTN